MKRLLSSLCALALLFTCLTFAPLASAEPLTSGITAIDATTYLCGFAQYQGIEADLTQLSIGDTAVTVPAGIFTLTAETEGNITTGVSISCGYLDADYAKTMGIIFGYMLSELGGISDSQDILSSIDFEAFDTLKASTQTLISGDYKIIAAVDPDRTDCYCLSLRLRDPSALLAASVTDSSSALSVLLRMQPEMSGYIDFTAETDSNGLLGQPGGYTSKVNFALTSIDPDAAGPDYSAEQGGSIEVFSSTADAIARIEHLLTVENTYLNYVEYLYLCGSTVLRLSSTISAEEAGELVTRFMLAVQDPSYSAAAVQSPAPAAAEAAVTGTDAKAEKEEAKDAKSATDEAQNATAAATPAPVSVQSGDHLQFGHYEQDNDLSNGKESIDWLVLKVDGNAAMLVSTYALDVYNTYWDSATWDNSTIRTWSNTTFLNDAFSASEQAALLTRTVPADRNPNYSTDPGADTQDRVFCLSYPEAASLMTASQRKAEATDYARKSKDVYTEGRLCYWWLRTPGRNGCGAAIVGTDGSFDYDVSYDGFCYGFRPAVWVDLALIAE